MTRSTFAILTVLAACGGPATPAPVTLAEAPRATPPAPAGTPRPPAGLRLPASVKPVRGTLDLTIDPALPTFSGVATYEVVLDDPASVVWLNATGLAISEGTATVGGTARPATIVPGDEQVFGLAFATPLPKGPATIAVTWTGPLDSERSVGFYRVAERPGEWYVYSFFEPIDARKAFPCFDDPLAKIPWRIILRVPAGQAALSNAAAESEVPDAGGRTRVTFAESRPMPTYLVALIVGPFDLVDGGLAGNHETPLRLAVPRGRGGETAFALKMVPKVVGLLEDYFGIPYMYGKLDVAVVPRFWGTMEHAGLVALGQPLMLFKRGEETAARRQRSANITIHELAHYWFGNYVTTAWWDDTWLNEAAASWIDSKITEAYEPSWDFRVDGLSRVHRAMRVDALPSAKKIRQPVESIHDIANAFDSQITYAKGSAVLRMFEEWLGIERFRKLVRGYLEAHAWRNTTAEDFLAALSAEAGADAAAGLKGFLEQPGVPLVTATGVCERGAPPRVDVTQQPFLPPGVGGDATRRWKFPVCVRWGVGATAGRACTLLTADAGSVALEGAKGCPDWIVPNAGASGYYRSAHDAKTFARLRAVERTRLSRAERVNLHADAAALVASGKLPIGAALAAIPQLAREGNLHLLQRAQDYVQLVREDLLGDADRARLARFLQRAFRPALRAVGPTPKPGDDDDARFRRTALLELLGGVGADAVLRRDAGRLARRWLDDHATLDAEVAKLYLDLAAIDGDRALFDRILAEARKAGDRREQADLLEVLGAFRDPALGDLALALILGTDLDQRDTLRILERRFASRGEPAAREQAWAWLRAHWDTVLGRMREDEKLKLFEVPQHFCDAKHRAELAAFLGERVANAEGAPRTLANSLEALDVCIAEQALNARGIADFLSRN